MFLALNKYLVTATILVTSFSCCIPFNAIASKYENDLINNVISLNFPTSFKVSRQQIEQLSWVLHHKNRTYDMDVAVDNNKVHLEIYRALTRLYCAKLLRAGTMAAYNSFIAAQLEIGITTPLQISTFMTFSKYIQQLSTDDYELIEAAIILTSVSLTPSAAYFSNSAASIDIKNTEALDFLSYTLREQHNVYPITWDIFNKRSNSKKLFYVLFPPHTNFRHMLYAEGGVGMFNYLRSMIAHGYMTGDCLDLWYAYWIVNISGFRGHVNCNGSIYLTEPVANAMENLRYFIYEMLDNPTYDPLLPYLEYRAKLLGYSNLPRDERLFMSHLGCLLRLYNISSGQRLYSSVNSIPLELRAEVMKEFYNRLQDASYPYPTHVPALFGNALYLTNGDIEKVIFKILPEYNKLLSIHKKNKAETPLCCNEFSALKNMEMFLKS